MPLHISVSPGSESLTPWSVTTRLSPQTWINTLKKSLRSQTFETFLNSTLYSSLITLSTQIQISALGYFPPSWKSCIWAECTISRPPAGRMLRISTPVLRTAHRRRTGGGYLRVALRNRTPHRSLLSADEGFDVGGARRQRAALDRSLPLSEPLGQCRRSSARWCERSSGRAGLGSCPCWLGDQEQQS
ncbi:hypothetical protein BDV98DRAFT_409492 [Pterulicium gracile]|uniref:Uncharacterized protein n=1 Tax=Pterulicium gracile TaxID=1884261 RepID=A0A5C3QLP2_9AGAR|nr:hypothetical protein BDV98DRAFT_409492 [Pterula gracilis]